MKSWEAALSMKDHKIEKFTITTLGCKVNQWESESIAKSLEANGFQAAEGSDAADVCIVNTCAVTHKAAMQSRQAVRQAARAFPGASIIVTGCYAQTAPQELARIPGVCQVIGHDDKLRIPEMLARAGGSPEAEGNSGCRQLGRHEKFATLPVMTAGSRSRPFLKVQDGCNAFCTYCIVPYARGRSRSMPPEEVIHRTAELSAAGFREIVLTGIHLGCYGLDLSPPTSLFQLLARIRSTAAIHRLRLSSIEPRELTDEIIDLAAASGSGPGGICPHFHIPLQSGDDTILKRMHRPYSAAFFKERVAKIHAVLPQAAIGVDVLVGFPGESEAAFENTLSLLDSLPISYLHVFPFSPRKGTPAYGFGDKVPPATVKQRCRWLRALGRQKKLAFYRKSLGRVHQVLVQSGGGHQSPRKKGITANYIPVWLEGEKWPSNHLVDVTLRRMDANLNVWGSE
jgi:threonylcarbamoyladenosine tRNA methylthiotransferase MtaB